MSYSAALAFVLEQEGGYVNDPDDPGGATNRGITLQTLRDWRKDQSLGPDDVKRLTHEETASIYHANYWLGGGCDRLMPKLALAHFDACVNMGTRRATRMLQRILNVPADGIIGPQTESAARNMDEEKAIQEYLKVRASYYKRLAHLRPSSAKFLKGWLARLRHVARETGVPIHESFAKDAV